MNFSMLVAVDVDWLVAYDVDIVTRDVKIVLIGSIRTIDHSVDISFRCDFRMMITFFIWMIIICQEDWTTGLDIRLSVLPFVSQI